MTGPAATPALNPKRWRVLAFLGAIQFVILLDATIVSVALPSMQRDLGFSQAHLSWVLNGYVIMAGGLLLLGGRLADMFGRRRVFVCGVALFGAGSALCAAAWNPAALIVGRFIQGSGEAFAGPAALGIIALLFEEPRERIRALSIWGGIAGAGSAAGSLVSGIITSFASWHWLFIINLPICVLAIVGILRLVRPGATNPNQPLDVWGAVTACGSLVAVIYGVLQAVDDDLTDPGVWVPVTVGVALLAAFVWIERTVAAPLIPRGFFRVRVRLVTNVLASLAAAAFASYPFTLTLFAQNVVGYSALEVGFMMLPLVVAIGVGLWLGSRLLHRLQLREVAMAACALAAVGLLLSSWLTVSSTFVWPILPGMVLFGLAIGVAMPTLTNGSLYATTEDNSSLASAVQTASHQVGSALGLALLAAIASVVTLRLEGGGMGAAAASTGGYAIALRLAAGVTVVAALVARLFMPPVRITHVPDDVQDLIVNEVPRPPED